MGGQNNLILAFHLAIATKKPGGRIPTSGDVQQEEMASKYTKNKNQILILIDSLVYILVI